jgi:UDP:flavonoid glycosyltransferase YjiC (YdhE family)
MQLGLSAHNASSYRRAARAIPTIYGFSPNVVPHPKDWGENDFITGYWFLDEQRNWQPPDSLQRFLDAGTAPLYVGFGSMPSSDPQKTLDLIIGALSKTGQRAIVAAGWSGAKGTTPSENIYLLDSAPHEWLFDRVAAVVHHGGSGTTGAGLRAGKATLIIPHLGDQPFWGRRVYELGVGAKPIPRHSLTVEKLAEGLQTLMTDTAIQAKAAELGAKIRAEHGVDNAVKHIERVMREKRWT